MNATISGLMTALLLILFVGIWVWSWSSRRKTAFDRMAYLPLEDDHPVPLEDDDMMPLSPVKQEDVL